MKGIDNCPKWQYISRLNPDTKEYDITTEYKLDKDMLCQLCETGEYIVRFRETNHYDDITQVKEFKGTNDWMK